MTQPRSDTPLTVRRRTGPRYQNLSGDSVPGAGSFRDQTALDEFRRHTKGLSTRLRMPSLESMRSGGVLSPHAIVRRYFVSAKTAGLSREWIQEFLVWAGNQADFIWPQCHTPRAVLQQREMQREAENDFAEKCLDLVRTPANVRACLDTCLAEIVAQKLVAAKLRRELEELEHPA